MSGLTLLAPLGLLGLIGIPLVILYHMRHTTPFVRDVPTLRFWRQAMQDEFRHERFRRPPLSLLLVLQLLLVAAIALALARPAASRALGGLSSRTEPQHLILLLDGSTSMSATDTPTGQTRYQVARDLTLDRLETLREGDVATLVLMGTHPITLEATDAASIRALRERLSGLPQPGGRVDLNAALELASNLLLPNLTDRIVLYSDAALVADQTVVEATGATIELERVGEPDAPNVAITDIATRGSAANPGQQQIFVHLRNFDDEPATVTLTITADGFEVSSEEIVLDPEGGRDVSHDLPAGAANASATIDASDPLAEDDTAATVLIQGASAGRRILLVSDAPSAIQRALSVLPGATVEVLSATDASDPRLSAGFDLVVYEGAPPAGAPPRAPILFVNQPEGGLLVTGGVMANPTAVSVRPRDPLLAGVELGGVTFGQTVVHELDSTMTEVVGAEAGPLVYRGRVPGTNEPMLVFTFDLAQSNLPGRVAFPILVANAVNELVPNPLPAAVPLGDPLVFRPHAGVVTVEVTSPTDEVSELPVQATANDSPQEAGGGDSRLQEVVFGGTGAAGAYRVAELDASGEIVGEGVFTVNAGHERESDLRATEDLDQTLARARSSDASESVVAREGFWPFLALVAFVVLLIEWLVTLNPWRGSAPRAARRPT
jgi:hypothetical protein